MEIIETKDTRAFVLLQRMDTALDALKARAAAVPAQIAEREQAFRARAATMGAAREALQALQAKKKALELEIASADEQIRKHQRDLNSIKDNHAFKALLTETETCKAKKDEFETAVLGLMDEIDAAVVEDARLKEEVKKLEAVKNAEVAVLTAEHVKLEHEAAEAAAARATAAAALQPGLLDKYEHLRGRRAGLAVARVHEEPASGKASCGGCHMGLTTQKVVDARRRDGFAICDECRRWLYSEQAVFGAAPEAN